MDTADGGGNSEPWENFHAAANSVSKLVVA